MHIENAKTFRNNISNKFLVLLDGCEKAENRSKNIEKGIYNWALTEANKRRVVKRWNHPMFVQIYIDRFRTILFES